MTTTTTREFQVVEGLTLKARNAKRKELEAEGWTVTPSGSNKRGWTLTCWRGEAPYVTRHTFNLREGGHEITPLYRRADGDGFEYIDGTPERA